MALYAHQKEIIKQDPLKAGLWLGTGSGKTLIALSLARGKTLVICPKTQKEDGNWERENNKNKLNVDLTVISKETFRRDYESLGYYETVIVDEAHTVLGVTPNTKQRKGVVSPRTSQLFEALELFAKNTKPKRLYLCSATIAKSTMTVWGAAKILGRTVDFYKFRGSFYTRLPMPGREVYVAKNNDKVKSALAGLVNDLGYVGRLSDYFDVPDQTFKNVYLGLTASQKDRLKSIKLEYPEAIVQVGKRHQIENGLLAGDEFNSAEEFHNEKLDKIIEYSEEFPQMIVFAKYTNQIDAIAKAVKKQVFILDGRTKDKGQVIKEALGSKEYVFIAQAQISSGWELPECPVMVFASRTYSFVDFEQAKGRILRANALKKNLYINLIVKGGVDEAVHKCLENKNDFNERLYV